MLKRLRHWLAHRLGSYPRKWVSWDHRDGSRWDGFVCEECGKVLETERWLPAEVNKRLAELLRGW